MDVIGGKTDYLAVCFSDRFLKPIETAKLGICIIAFTVAAHLLVNHPFDGFFHIIDPGKVKVSVAVYVTEIVYFGARVHYRKEYLALVIFNSEFFSYLACNLVQRINVTALSELAVNVIFPALKAL